MVYRRRRRARRRRKPRRTRRRTGRRRRSTRRRIPTAISYSKLVKLKWQDSRVVTTTSGTPWHYKFNLAGLFDPNLTGVGGSAYGFSRWMNFYNYYQVVGVKVKLSFTAVSTVENLVGTSCLLASYPDIVNPTSFAELFEQPRAVTRTCQISDSTTLTSAPRMYHTSHYYSIKSLVPRESWVPTNFRGTVSTNPSSVVPLWFLIRAPTESVFPDLAVAYTAVFTFYVKFTSPKLTSVL